MTLIAGIDMGARSAKCVLVDNGVVVGSGLARMKPDFAGLAQDVLELALEQAGRTPADIDYIAKTGL